MAKRTTIASLAVLSLMIAGCREELPNAVEQPAVSEQEARRGPAVHHRPEEEVRQESVMEFLRALPEERAVRGSIAAQEGLIQTERLIVAKLREMGYEPQLQELTWNLAYQKAAEARGEHVGPIYGGPQHPESTPELEGNTWHNIIVEIPGRSRGREVLIVGAHFDAVAGSPGADDNGTGTAALLEIARVLKGRELERTVRLVFFNLEEIGIRGAKEYAKSLMEKWDEEHPEHEKLVGMISLEMLGYFSDEPGSQRSPIPRIEGVFDPPTTGDFIGMATVRAFSDFARALERGMRKAAPDLKIVVVDFPPVAPPDFLRSDHAPFMMLGQPAVMITDTSEYRNPHYHRASDRVETLDPERFTLVVKAVAGAVLDLANAGE
jgi:aminopeptidase YwaD